MGIYRFGPFEVRTRTGELYKFGTRVRLRGQPFEILRALLIHPGEVVTREEMRAQLWPSDTFVDFEHGINASLRKLRMALGDSAIKPLYIETLPGVGYRFVAPLETLEEASAEGSAPSVVQATTIAPNDELGETEPLEGTAEGVWRSRFFLMLATVVIVGALILLAGERNWRVVQGNAARRSESPASVSSVRDSAAVSAENGTWAASGSVSSHHATGPSPALSPIRGKVWVVSVAQASHVAFPTPRVAPDATFITKGIAYLGTAPKNCYTLASFLTECGVGGYELKFSGLGNPNLNGEAAGPATAMSGRTWGILIEFSGTAELANGQDISILHDDGVALEIDGKIVPGFDGGMTSPVLESAVYTGPSAVHSFDLLYANATGGGAWLLFYPALY